MYFLQILHNKIYCQTFKSLFSCLLLKLGVILNTFYVYSNFLVYCYCYLSMSFSIFLLRFLGFSPILLISKGYWCIKEMNSFLTTVPSHVQ